jgi:hypothetical protein
MYQWRDLIGEEQNDYRGKAICEPQKYVEFLIRYVKL